MGSVCSKSDTKKKKDTADDKGGNDKANARQPRASSRDSDPHYPVHDSDDVQGEKAAAASAPAGPAKDAGSNFTLSTAPNEGKGEGEVGPSASPGSPQLLNATRPAVHGGPTTDATCPPPSQKGENYDQWFPPEHDAGMKLGDGKYDGVGVQSPSSDAKSAELHSLASTPSYRVPSPVTPTAAPPPPPPPQAHAYDPMRFIDEDSAAPETASSAFVTPRELRDGSSVASYADNASLVSHGSMASQHPHGYRYYNSSNVGADVLPTPASSHRQSFESAQQTQRSAKTAMTVTNVRTNRQMPARSSVGMATPLSRQSSRAGSDRFQSCRSLGDASASAASYASLGSPAGVVTEADVRLLSGQQGGRRGSLGSQLSGHPPSTPGDGGNGVFYSCRSLATASEQSGASPLYGPFHSSRNASPISVQSPSSSSPLLPMRNASSNSLSNLRGVAGAAPLPPRSPRGSPMPAFGNTPNAQQEFLHRQASRQSGLGDRPASEAFFSVGGSSRDVFLDLPSAAETSTVYTLEDDQDLELTLAARGQQGNRTSNAGDGDGPASPASHYSSVAAAPSPQEAPQQRQQQLQLAESVGSPHSSAASSAWLASPVVSATKLPAERPRRGTTTPHVDGATPSSVKGPEESASDYDADRSSAATSQKESPPKQPTKRAVAPAKKAYYTKADFPPNPETPPQAKALAAPAAAVADVVAAHPLSPPKPTLEVAVMESTYVTLSTPSETSTRKSGATRPTAKFPGGEDREIDGDEQGDAVRPRALEAVMGAPPAPPSSPPPPPTPPAEPAAPHYTLPTASSTHSFSTVASSFRRDQQEQEQEQQDDGSTSPRSSAVDGQGKSAEAGTTTVPRPRRRTRTQPKRQPRRRSTARSSLQQGKVAADTNNAAAAPAPRMTNPNPWVPGGAADGATSAHVNPFAFDESGQPHLREHSAGATPASATTPRTSGGSHGRPVRRSVTPTPGTAAATTTSGGVGGRTSIAPGRRSTHHAATAAAAAPGGMRAAKSAHPARRTHPPSEEPPNWASLTPSPSSGGPTKPLAKLATAAKARKSKKAAEAAALATPPPSSSLPPAPDLQPVTRTTDTGDSVVEYELFTGELADVEADSTAEDTVDGSAPRTAQASLPQDDEQQPPQESQSQQQQQLPSQPQGPSSRTPPAFRTSPKLHAEPRRAGGFRVSPDASPNVLTSAEASGFMQPYTEAQLAAELNSAAAGLTEGAWLTNAAATTKTTLVTTEDGAVVTHVEVVEVPPLPEEVPDEGYLADSGMPNTHAVPLPSSPPPPPPPPRSVSATSNDDGAGSTANTTAAATVGKDADTPQKAAQVNSPSSPHADVARGNEQESAGGNVVDLSSNSSASESAASTESPVVVG